MISSTQKLMMAVSGIQTETLVEGWNLSTAVFLQRLNVRAYDSGPRAVYFKPDGTKMYFTGTSSDAVHEYDLSTAWDVSTASYFQSFYVGGEETNPYSLSFKSDGTKMYILGTTGDDVNEYNLSTAWAVSTASYFQNFSVASQETSPYEIVFKPDGTKMYILGGSSRSINEYNLSTAWDVSTASYSRNFSVQSQEFSSTGLYFKPDGTKMYITGFSNDSVHEYNLSTAWNVSTASYFQNFYIGTEEPSPFGLFFKYDGTSMYVVGSSSDSINQYILTS